MLRPYSGYVMVVPDDIEELEGGLSLPEKGGDKPMSGLVVENNAHGIQSIKNGMRVYYRAFAGEDISYEGMSYKLVSERDLVAYDDSKGVK